MLKYLAMIPLLFAYNVPKGTEEIRQGLKNERPAYMDQIGVDEHKGEMIELGLSFTNHLGQKVILKDLFKDKPTLFMLVYYNCPTLCNTHLQTLVASLNRFSWKLGQDYHFVVLSVDPKETAKDAYAKRELLTSMYSTKLDKDQWQFLIGDQKAIDQVSSQLGIKFVWDHNMEQFMHPAVVTALSPQGKISLYYHGLTIKPLDLKLGLVEAGQGRVGTLLDQALLYCMQYDPKEKKYALYAFNIMRTLLIFIVALLGVFLLRFWYKEFKTKKV